MSLVDIESAILARVAAVLGTRCRACVPLPGGLEQLAAVLGTTVLTPPCLAAVWRGWSRPILRQGGLDTAAAGLHGESQWSLIAVLATPAGEVARRRGDVPRGLIGAYELAELAARALHDFSIDEVGTVRVAHLAPIEDEALRGRGLSVAEVRIALSHDLMDDAAAFDALPDFLTAGVDYGTAQDVQTIPQDRDPELAPEPDMGPLAPPDDPDYVDMIKLTP